MAIEGPLEELSLQDVLQLLELARKTGVLTVRSERHNDEGVVHLDRGLIIFARRRRSRRLLGQQLLRAGKLTEQELDRALEMQRANPSLRLSEIFLELGSATHDDLAEHLRFQLEENVYDMMSWKEGYFRFEERPDVFRAGLQVHMRVESLLMEGARRVDEWSRLKSKVPSLESVPVLAPPDESNHEVLDLRAEEWEVLAEIDGERDLRQIAADLGRASFEVGKILYGLVNAGIVRILDRSPHVPHRDLSGALEEAESLLDHGRSQEALRLIEQMMVGYADHVPLLLLAGRALVAESRLRAAAEAFARAAALAPQTAEAHYHLGFTAIRIGELERATTAWQTYLKVAGRGPERDSVTRALEATQSLAQILTRQHETPHEQA
ncbi:MAG: DUF4388 domain-containing protein [Longimicrobiales bacterium]